MYHIVHLRPIHTSPALVARGTALAPALVENQNHIDFENFIVINMRARATVAGAGEV